VLAVAPRTACDLLGLPEEAPLARWAAAQFPVRAACLDVALHRLLRPEVRFALGLDRPLYFSVHSAAARLAPDGVAVAHVMKYLGPGPETPAPKVGQELEAFLEQVQPGWREHTRTQRLLPGMTVAHALPQADEGGLAGRPGVALAERPNLFLAGDWVGSEGMLADASAASAALAARRVLAVLDRAPVWRPVHAES
jgi:phytoene dehydrogenase-like protein